MDMAYRNACTACMAASFSWVNICVSGQGWQILLSERECLSAHLVMATKKYWIKICKVGGAYAKHCKLSWEEHPHKWSCSNFVNPFNQRGTNSNLSLATGCALFSLCRWLCSLYSPKALTLSFLHSLNLSSPHCVIFYSNSVSPTLPLYLFLSLCLPHSQTQWTIPVLLKCHQQEWVKRE